MVSQHVFQRRERAIVHVRGGAADLAQPRRLESVLCRLQPQHGSAATVLIRQTDIVERVVGESKAAVAVHASRLAGEQSKSRDLILRQRLLVASYPAIEPGVRRDEGALVSRNRL